MCAAVYVDNVWLFSNSAGAAMRMMRALEDELLETWALKYKADGKDYAAARDAIQHHLDVAKSVREYRPSRHVASDLAGPTGPMAPVLAKLDAKLQKPTKLSHNEFRQLVAFVRFGLLDERSLFLDSLIPVELISGLEPLEFQD